MPAGEGALRERLRLLRLGVVGQTAHERETETQAQESRAEDEQGRDDDHGEQSGDGTCGRDAPDRVRAARVSSRCRLGQKRSGPRSASTAGMKVIATPIVTSTVSAMPGPNERKIDSFPTTSVSEPRATIRPAVKMIGRFSTVAACAAGESRLARSEAPPHRRHEEDRVVGHEAEHERDQDRLDLFRHLPMLVLADPREQVHRDDVGDRCGREPDERRGRRSERQQQDEEDQRDRRDRDARQRLLDLIELRGPREEHTAAQTRRVERARVPLRRGELAILIDAASVVEIADGRRAIR